MTAGNNSQLNLTTQTPLYFAASLQPVTVDRNGNLAVGPVAQVIKPLIGALAVEASTPLEDAIGASTGQLVVSEWSQGAWSAGE